MFSLSNGVSEAALQNTLRILSRRFFQGGCWSQERSKERAEDNHRPSARKSAKADGSFQIFDDYESLLSEDLGTIAGGPVGADHPVGWIAFLFGCYAILVATDIYDGRHSSRASRPDWIRTLSG